MKWLIAVLAVVCLLVAAAAPGARTVPDASAHTLRAHASVHHHTLKKKCTKKKGKKVCKRVKRKATPTPAPTPTATPPPTATPGPRITNSNDGQTFVVTDNLTGVSVAVSNFVYGSQDSLLVAARNGLYDWMQVTEKNGGSPAYSSSYANFQAADAAGHTYTPGPGLPPTLAGTNFSSATLTTGQSNTGWVEFDMPIAKYQLNWNENNALPWTYVADIAPNSTGLHLSINSALRARFSVLTGPAARAWLAAHH